MENNNNKISQPIISFIIPVLNEEKQLAKTIQPLKDLNWLEKEIIVADGGSTDRTIEIAKLLADKVYVRPEGQKNKSIGENRNKGASLADGKYLFFMDCGVTIGRLDEFLRAVLSVMEDKKTVGLTLELRFYPEEESKIDRMNMWLINKGIEGVNKIRLGAAMGWVQVVNSRAFQKINGYNENLIANEDYDLFLRLSRIGKTQLLKNFIAFGTAVRFHRDGWPKMILIWFLNFLWYWIKGRSFSKEWKKIDD